MPNLNDELSCLVPDYGPIGGSGGSGVGKVVVVGALAASHRLRNAFGLLSLMALLTGLLMAAAGSVGGLVFLFAGLVGLFWWIVACALSFFGRIVGQDAGLIAPFDREADHARHVRQVLGEPEPEE
jgi:hypothetical protein